MNSILRGTNEVMTLAIENLKELKSQLELDATRLRESICIKDSLCIKDKIWDTDDMFKDIKQRVILEYIEKLLDKIKS
ncbi:hypothetical protein [Clostridium sp. AWRP]|uniref:hypothetical protein n=1 Tax=Clostridium sp. AWRP TaxID=2212991 RepID=UPI000FD7CD93|nr:hypothetical protein [Clostridium sp. AWRP]